MASSDKSLEEFLAGKSDLSDRYRDSFGDEPETHLDNAILDAARRTTLTRIPPRLVGIFSSAAVMVLAVSLFWQLPEVDLSAIDESEQLPHQMPSAPAADPAPAFVEMSEQLTPRHESMRRDTPGVMRDRVSEPQEMAVGDVRHKKTKPAIALPQKAESQNQPPVQPSASATSARPVPPPVSALKTERFDYDAEADFKQQQEHSLLELELAEPSTAAESAAANDLLSAGIAHLRQLIDAGDLDAARMYLQEMRLLHPEIEIPNDLLILLDEKGP